MGILNSLYTTNVDVLPSQTVPLKEKIKKPENDSEKTWSMMCMDALESIGRSQYFLNLPLIENYEMIKGRFIFSHYFETEGYSNLLSELSQQVELPNYLRHYDIISQVVNTMSGEWQKRPDVFKVKHVGDGATNEYLRTKQELTTQYVFDKINTAIDAKLAEMGIDLEREDFESEEEAQLYYEEIDTLRKSMTPQDIQNYMDKEFMTTAEKWANFHKEYSKERFNLSEKEKVEFEDMLVSDRTFRHFYLTADYYDQETWNPINTFFHKSPDVNYIEDGDYVGRVFSLSINTIIDRYGHLMTNEDFELLQGKSKKNKTKWNDHKYGWVYDNYLVPFNSYPEHSALKQAGAPVPNSGIPELDPTVLNGIYSGKFYRENEGFYFVTEAYWKTQKKLFKLTYLDEETGLTVVKIVDELYKIPKHFKESKKIFTDDHDLDTYSITYVNEVWKGIKINTAVDKDLKKDLYLGIGPNEFQFKGTSNMYGCRLPVCGQIYSVRNSNSMSLVDLMKPYQIAYNVSMNQLYNLMEKEIGMFIVMDVNMFPNSKDWGGEDSWEKWMTIAKNLGMVPADTSPSNIRNSIAATGGYLPKVIDMNLAGQMVSRINLCKFFEEQALKQVGFNQYRVGSYSSSTTATGVEQGVSTSYSQTESYFTNFSNYLRRVYQMDLEIAQYVESQKDVIEVIYQRNDYSRGFLKILGDELLLSELGVFVTNSQEHLRQLEMMRQYVLTNNTAGLDPVSVIDVIISNSPKAIREKLEKSYERLIQKEQEAMEMQERGMQQEAAIEEAKLQKEDEHFYAKLQNELDKKYIEAGVSVLNTDPSDPKVPEDRSVENAIKAQQMENEHSLKERELNIKEENLKLQREIETLKAALKQQEINAKLQIQDKETQSVAIMNRKKNK